MENERKAETLEEKKSDAKEVAEILKEIPKDRKGEALGLIRGFALGVKEEKEVV